MKFISAAVMFVGLFVALGYAQVAPTIASISNSRRLNQGESLSLSVSVNGTAPFTYAWKKGGSPIAGATASTYLIDAVAVTDAGSYSVTITNSTGSVTSGAILIDVTPATAPTFNSQPYNVTCTVGDTISIYASVSGTTPITYVWKNGTTTVATSTSYYYSKANAQLSDAGTYTITATNAAGSVTSSSFTVTVNAVTVPVFSSNPSSTTIDTGSYLSLYSYVSNSNGVTYQWKKDGVAIANATSSSFWKSEVTASDAGVYTVVATNSAGSTTSLPATVTVRPPVAPSSVSISPASQTVTVGDSFSLYVSYNGTSPFTFQWRKDGTPIPGATSSNFYKSNVTADDAGTYSVVVTNSVGSVTSAGSAVSISTAQLPVITAQPVGTTAYPGDYITLTVNASGTGPLSYQWKKDGAVVAGATSSYYYLANSAAASDAGVYTVTVTNAQGSTTSNPATVTILSPVAPAIVRQPAGVSVMPGETLQLTVSATGKPLPTYQWKKDGVAIANATGDSYYKSNVASSDSGNYTVVVTNSAGSVTSETAAVSVGAPSAPVIYSHPASASLLLGDGFYGLTVNYAYSEGTTVQWYRDGVAIDGANSYYYYISAAQPGSAGSYTAKVTNSAGSTTSYAGVITVDLSTARPVIIYTSGSHSVSGGNSIAPYVSLAPGITSYTVAWKKDGVVVPNATELYLNLSNFSLSLAGTYTAEVTAGGATYTSRPVVLSLLDAGVSPRITNQPASSVLTVGQSVYLGVAATGELPLSYQWRKDGVDIPNATYSSYNIWSVTTANAGNYSVVVTNRNGSSTSAVAALTVNSAAIAGLPIIGRQPASQLLTAGQSYLNLSVGVLNLQSGTTFQWYKDGTEIPYATSDSYYGSTATTAMAGRYKVVVTTGAGSTTSDEAIITVTTRTTGPTFTTQPVSATGYTGGTVTFTAAATGNSTISYQWRKNGTAIAGATTATLTLTNLQVADAAGYSVVAANADGTTASAIAELTVVASTPPTITAQPVPQVSGRSGSVSFSVTATGTPAPTYQWKKNGTDISNATSATLSLLNLVSEDAGNYSVVVTNPAGSVTSNPAALTVYDQLPYAPVFTTQPQSSTRVPGESVTLLVAVTGFPTPTLQWYKNGTAIAGERAAILTLGKMTAAIEGQYHAVATNEIGSTASSVATISLGADPQRLVNVSSRGVAGKDANTLIAGLVIAGSAPKNVMIRAIGPSLTPLGVSNALGNPRLRLFKGSTQILENDDWSTGESAGEIAAAASRLGAFGLATGTADAAFITRLNPGAYTAHVTTADASTGVVLLEVYDADLPGESDTRVVNLSSRGPVGTGDDILIVGFVINGSAPKKVLVRGVGPALVPQGVAGALADPMLQLYAGSKLINENDNWSAGSDASLVSSAATACGAAPLVVGSKDAAILVELQPGVYSAHVRGVSATTGVALVEVYEVP